MPKFINLLELDNKFYFGKKIYFGGDNNIKTLVDFYSDYKYENNIKINCLLGGNGCGKTRLLRAMFKKYSNDNDFLVLLDDAFAFNKNSFKESVHKKLFDKGINTGFILILNDLFKNDKFKNIFSNWLGIDKDFNYLFTFSFIENISDNDYVKDIFISIEDLDSQYATNGVKNLLLYILSNSKIFDGYLKDNFEIEQYIKSIYLPKEIKNYFKFLEYVSKSIDFINNGFDFENEDDVNEILVKLENIIENTEKFYYSKNLKIEEFSDFSDLLDLKIENIKEISSNLIEINELKARIESNKDLELIGDRYEDPLNEEIEKNYERNKELHDLIIDDTEFIKICNDILIELKIKINIEKVKEDLNLVGINKDIFKLLLHLDKDNKKSLIGDLSLFFNIETIFGKKIEKNLSINENINNNIIFSNLSSGQEMNIIRLVNIYYNIINSNQNNVIVLIDEPDLHLHLDWQKNYIKELIDIFSNIDKNIQFVIATHSPFIISDLPTDSIIKLEKTNENVEVLTYDGKRNHNFFKNFSDYNNYFLNNENYINTFGANYIDIINNGFFFNKGDLMGSFSSQLIGKIAKLRREEITKEIVINNIDEIKIIENMIGDKFLANNLLYFKPTKNEKNK